MDASVAGVVVKRRLLGQHLAFATVESASGSLTQVTFKRARFDAGSSEMPFPARRPDLRLGDKVVLTLGRDDGGGDDADRVVLGWRSSGLGGGRAEGRLENEAQADASLSAAELRKGVCGQWALLGSCAAAACDRRHAFGFAKERERAQQLRARRGGELVAEERAMLAAAEASRGFAFLPWSLPLMDRQPGKAERSEVFATFLVEQMGVSGLVLDVAGGSGELAAALERKGLEVVVVDPRGESRDQAKQVTQLREFFDVSFDQRHPELAARASAFVGLHPDQATNAIVSVGARLRKHWAVVPCCVFAEEYPRATKKGGPVTTTSDLSAWLLAGEGGGKLNRTVKLEFAGKDRVIFSSADLQTDVGY